MARKRKKKKARKPREKLRKGLDVFMDWVKKQKPKDLGEIALMIGLAYAGYDAFHTWKGALWGPVSLKLAQTQGGTPPVAQAAGVGGLAVLGLALGVDKQGGYKTPPIGPQKEFILTFGESCPEGYSLLTTAFGFNYCVRTKKS